MQKIDDRNDRSGSGGAPQKPRTDRSRTTFLVVCGFVVLVGILAFVV